MFSTLTFLPFFFPLQIALLQLLCIENITTILYTDFFFFGFFWFNSHYVFFSPLKTLLLTIFHCIVIFFFGCCCCFERIAIESQRDTFGVNCINKCSCQRAITQWTKNENNSWEEKKKNVLCATKKESKSLEKNHKQIAK